jgi:UDP-GlcNAc3NAcA epimerase
MRLLSVVGTRPQLIKAAALQPALAAGGETVFVDTGQHYDDALAGAFFTELDLPRPDHSLGVGGGTQAEQAGRMLAALEPILVEERPAAVVVYGDTNSTLAAALAAAKLQLPVAHVEAGLRSFDRTMPEEVNRVVADHLSTWCFAPTPTAVANLAVEGIVAGVSLVGDVLQDLASRTSVQVRDPGVLVSIAARLAGGRPLELQPGGFLFVTVHRAANRVPAALAAWADLLRAVAAPDRPVLLPLHPGTRIALERAGLDLGPDVRVVEPLGYRSTLALQLHSAAVLTDSGGVQREAAWLGVPCLVLRDSTEWVEAVARSEGRMVVVGLDRDRAVHELERLAPPSRAADDARRRAAGLRIPEAGAVAAISRALGCA